MTFTESSFDVIVFPCALWIVLFHENYFSPNYTVLSMFNNEPSDIRLPNSWSWLTESRVFILISLWFSSVHGYLQRLPHGHWLSALVHVSNLPKGSCWQQHYSSAALTDTEDKKCEEDSFRRDSVREVTKMRACYSGSKWLRSITHMYDTVKE